MKFKVNWLVTCGSIEVVVVDVVESDTSENSVEQSSRRLDLVTVVGIGRRLRSVLAVPRDLEDIQ